MMKGMISNELKSIAKLLVAKESADQEYQRRSKDVAKMLAQIKKEVAKHNKKQKQDPQNWGFVGDMGHVYSELVDIHSFLQRG